MALGRTVAARAAALAAVLLLAACSGDPSGQQPAAPDRATTRASLVSLFAGNDPARGDEARQRREAECFADELLERVTPAELVVGGVVAADGATTTSAPTFDAELADHWVAATLACTDFVDSSTRAQEQVSKGAIDGPAYAACLRPKVDDDLVRRVTRGALLGEPADDAVRELAAAQEECRAAATPGD